MIRLVGVVVPAHNEQDLLPSCLASLRRAARALPGTPVRLVVVADACRDRTAEVARRGGAVVVTAGARSVGAARAAGVREVLRRAAHLDPADIWLATTDADTLVPARWLREQARYGDEGWDAVAGTVRVADWSGYQPGHALAVPQALRRGSRPARPRARRQPRLPRRGLPEGRRVP